MRKQKSFRFLLGAMAALWSVVPMAPAQAAPSDTQAIDQLLASAAPGDKSVKTGDMLLSVEALRAYRGKLGAGKQAASAFYQTDLWLDDADNRVPYVFDPSLMPAQRNAFILAAREWETAAVLKFVPRTFEDDYIRVYTDKNGESFSQIGRVGGMQDMSLSAAPANATAAKYDAVHEIGHALGLLHEEKRSDRNQFVTIDFANVVMGKRGEFAIIGDSLNVDEYDFDSVMHSAKNIFAIDPTKPTIVVKPLYTQNQDQMGQRNHLSFGDRQGMGAVYGFRGQFPRPLNDKFAQAERIEGTSGSVDGTVFFATKEPGEDNHAGTRATTSIWYRWIPAKRGRVTFRTEDSGFDTVLSVYLGSGVSTVTNVASNDDIFPQRVPPTTPAIVPQDFFALSSSVTFQAQAGAIYYIAINSAQDLQYKSGDIGDSVLSWDQSVDNTRYKLSGVVRTNTSPAQGLGGVIISLSGAESSNSATAASATTNASGEYTIGELLPGIYNLRSTKGGYRFEPTTLRVTLTANDSTANNFTGILIPLPVLPSISVSDVSVREGNGGAPFLTFNLTMSAASRDPITLEYETANGTANSGNDYVSTRGTITFAPGVTTLSINVGLRPDLAPEPQEAFTLKIAGGNGARIGKSTGTATIVDDDVAAAAAASANNS